MEQVYIYRRVSTPTQVDGYGLDTQLRIVKDYCKRNKFAVKEVFTDEGVSGTTIDREGLTSLLASFNGIKKVVVLNTSRLWRDDMTKALIQREFRQTKADVISVEQPTYSIYNSDPNDFLVNGLMELLDSYERMSINMRLAKGRKTKAFSGDKACGVAPLGYRWGHDANIEVDENQADTVRLIYSKYVELSSIGKVQAYLGEQGIFTSRGNNYSKQSIANILSNDFYKGIVTHGNIKQKGNHQTIISDKLFGRVQRILTSNIKNKKK